MVMGEREGATGGTNLLLIKKTSTSLQLLTVKFLLVPNWELLGARTQILTNSLFEKAKVHHNEDLPFHSI